MVALRRRIEPDVCTFVDKQENSYIIEIVLPYVRKENIKLRVNYRCLLVFATNGDIDYAKYIPFCYPVVPDRVTAAYEHGLLRVKVPLRI